MNDNMEILEQCAEDLVNKIIEGKFVTPYCLENPEHTIQCIWSEESREQLSAFLANNDYVKHIQGEANKEACSMYALWTWIRVLTTNMVIHYYDTDRPDDELKKSVIVLKQAMKSMMQTANDERSYEDAKKWLEEDNGLIEADAEYDARIARAQ